MISIHALREEGDLVCLTCPLYALLFLSTPSARRATAARGKSRPAFPISIHALREEGDLSHKFFPMLPEKISIHALREEGDQGNTAALSVTTIFLSTPSARRATAVASRLFESQQFLSTPSARRATYGLSPLFFFRSDFYPRPPRGGRHRQVLQRTFRAAISIHALREEGDAYVRASPMSEFNFYPRPPRGGRLIPTGGAIRMMIFLSTPSARRATFGVAIAAAEHRVFLSTPSARRATKM